MTKKTERKVLILEPDDDLAMMIEQFLRSSRFLVARARDPGQAYWMAPSISPNVVLVDYWPSDGVEVATNFRNDGLPEDVPLVLVVPENLYESKPELIEELKEAYDGFLYKPFADTDLLRVIENFTGFGESSEEEVGSALHQLLDASEKNPELRNVVKEIQGIQSKQKNLQEEVEYVEFEEDHVSRIEELEGELAAAWDLTKQQNEKISELLSKIRDLELDHSLATEASEEEKKNILDQLNKVEKDFAELAEKKSIIDAENEALKEELNKVKQRMTDVEKLLGQASRQVAKAQKMCTDDD